MRTTNGLAKGTWIVRDSIDVRGYGRRREPILGNEVLRNRDVRAQRTSDASGSTAGLVPQLVLCTLKQIREGY